MEVEKWHVFEAAFEAEREYDNPLWDASLTVSFRSPSGREYVVDGFHDGGRRWLVRFSPNEEGEWQWSTSSPDAGLSDKRGEFRCVPYEGDNPVYLHGNPKLSDDGRYFVYADGTPFFWLGDTAWNGVLRSKEEDWARYLENRKGLGFTAIQFVSTDWRGCSRNPFGERAYEGEERIKVNPDFFRRMDAKVKAINEHGMIAAPVVLWAFREGDPGVDLPEEDAVRLARYIVARWGAYQVIWILGGDGNYEGERAERWWRIGRSVFKDRHYHLVTMHPRGQSWVADEFAREEWFDFVGYQSGHGESEKRLKWLVMGPPAKGWRKSPPRPVVNLEPNYETHPSYERKKPFTDYEVRRAVYWSLLVSPTAGVTYGHNRIWVWAEEPRVPEGHESIGEVQPWHTALDAAGAQNMATMRAFFDSLPWWRLRPAPELLLKQPGSENVRRFVAAARTVEGDYAVVYLPVGCNICIKTELLKRPCNAFWFNPRTGKYVGAGEVKGEIQLFTALDDTDWLLCIKPE